MKKLILMGFAFAVLGSSFLSGATQAEWHALATLYNTTGGKNWNRQKNWCVTHFKDPCPEDSNDSWEGVQCKDGHVLRIYIENNNLIGEIPTEIGNLPNLDFLRLSGNNLSGTIPESIRNLTQLQILELNNNNLSGTIPDDFWGLSQLRHVNVSRNNFTGTIPDDFWGFTNLGYFDIGDNNLTGTIPAKIWEFPNMNTIRLSKNNFTGDIPSFPTNVDLGAYKLEIIYIDGNNLTGTIPEGIVNLKKLRRFEVHNNNLEGTIPDGIQNLPIYRGCLRLANNYSLYTQNDKLIEFIDSKKFPHLKTTYYDILETNTQYVVLQKLFEETNGANWKNNANWKNMIDPCNSDFRWEGVTCEGGTVTGLELHDNNLSGDILDDIGKLTALKRLELSDNNLTGTIPSSIQNLTNLEYLKLYDNCYLSTSDSNLISFIDNNTSDQINGANYDYIIQTNKCDGVPTVDMAPIYHLLLD